MPQIMPCRANDQNHHNNKIMAETHCKYTYYYFSNWFSISHFLSFQHSFVHLHRWHVNVNMIMCTLHTKKAGILILMRFKWFAMHAKNMHAEARAPLDITEYVSIYWFIRAIMCVSSRNISNKIVASFEFALSLCVCVCFAIEGAKMMNWCFTHACPCPYKHGIAFCYCTIIIIICQLAPTTWTMPVPMRRRVAHCRTNTLIISLLLVRFIICNAIIIILLMFETHFDFIQEHKIYGFSYQTCIFEFSFLRRLPDLRIYRIAINTVFWPKLRLLAASHLPNIGKDLSHICAIWIMGIMVKLSALLHPKCATRLPQQIWIQ